MIWSNQTIWLSSSRWPFPSIFKTVSKPRRKERTLIKLILIKKSRNFTRWAQEGPKLVRTSWWRHQDKMPFPLISRFLTNSFRLFLMILRSSRQSACQQTSSIKIVWLWIMIVRKYSGFLIRRMLSIVQTLKERKYRWSIKKQRLMKWQIFYSYKI